VDRFLIGTLVSMTAVAYYATPSEVVSRLLILPSAIVGVLFPAFSTGFAQDPARTRILFIRGLKYTFLALFPCVLVVIVFAREGLAWWVGPEFAQHGTLVLQCLAIGVFFNGLANVPFALVQGAGRPDITGKLHLVELPAYGLLLWVLVRAYGIQGAAIAWSVRTLIDALLLFGFARDFLPTSASLRQGMVLLPAFSLLTLIIAALVQGLAIKAVFLLVVILGFCATAWLVLLSPEERSLAQQYL